MNTSTLARGLLFFFLQLLFASQVYAQATRTWVSGVGDDANPCSRTAPCKTFAGAISKTAPNGEINVLDPGGFGAVTITKAITIDGSGGSIAGVLVSGTNAIVVSAGLSDSVTLRNLDIDGLGTGLNGVRFIQGRALRVENCKIYGFTQQGIDINPSTGASSAFISGVNLRSNTQGAVYVHPTGSATVNVTMDDSTMQLNGRGLRAEDNSNVVVSNTIATDNTANGFVALATTNPVNMTIEGGVSSLNGAVGVYAGALATVRISNVAVTGNNVGLQTVGGGVLRSFGNNRVNGNGTEAISAPTSTITQM